MRRLALALCLLASVAVAQTYRPGFTPGLRVFGPLNLVAWVSAFVDSLPNGVGGYAGYTARSVIASTRLSGSGTRARVTVAPPPQGGTIGALYIGQNGNTCGFTSGTKVQVLFGGSGSLTIAAAGPAVVSDTFTLPQSWDTTKSYTVAANITSGYFAQSGTTTGITSYYTGGATADQDAPGCVADGNAMRVVSKIEVAP